MESITEKKNNAANINRRLKREIEKRYKKLSEFANACEISQATVSEYIHQKRELTGSMKRAIAYTLGLDVEYLFPEPEPEPVVPARPEQVGFVLEPGGPASPAFVLEPGGPASPAVEILAVLKDIRDILQKQADND